MNIIFAYFYNKYSEPGQNRKVAYYGYTLIKISFHNHSIMLFRWLINTSIISVM